MPDSFVTPWTVAHLLPCPWDFSGKNTRVGSHFLLQGIVPTQGLNLGLLLCRHILCHLNHTTESLGSPDNPGRGSQIQESIPEPRRGGERASVKLVFLCWRLHPTAACTLKVPLKSRASSLILICSRLLNRTKPATACKLVSKDDSSYIHCHPVRRIPPGSYLISQSTSSLSNMAPWVHAMKGSLATASIT